MTLAVQKGVNGWQEFLHQLEAQNPILCDHLREWQNVSLADYADNTWHGLNVGDVDAGHLFKQRPISPEFLRVVAETCEQRFGDSQKILAQLSLSPVVLTAHHTAPLFHPLSLHTLMVACAGRNPPKVVPVLSTDWVPMDNLFYPRGLLLPSISGLQSINVFPKNAKKNTVASMSAFTEDLVENAWSSVSRMFKSGVFSSAQYACYQALLEQYYGDKTLLAAPSYSDQCSRMNSKMCKAIFPELDFAFINISEIATKLLIAQIQQTDSLMHRMLFDKNNCNAVLKGLDGVAGCWNLKKQQGSIFFWQLENKKMVPLYGFDGKVLSNKQFEVKWNPEAIVKALMEGRIIPGMTLVFAMLMLAMGVVCIGGMRQISYSKKIRDVVAATFKESSAHDYDWMASHPVDRFMAGMYGAVNNKGNPFCITDLLSQGRNYNDVQKKDWSLQQAVLAASRDILSLS